MDSAAQTRAERLAGEIADAILSGDLAPGLRLDEQGLAERYNVSRTPVREALRQLGSTGLIESRPRRGVVVARVTPEKLEELFIAMGEIEATCARLSALGMTPIERRRLGALHDRMAALVAANDTAAYAAANDEYHAAIFAGAHNSVLLDIAVGLGRRLAPYRRAQFRAPGRLLRSHAEHGDIAQAILRGDAAAAHAAMLHHVSLVEDAFDQLFFPAAGKEAPARSRPVKSGRTAGQQAP